MVKITVLPTTKTVQPSMKTVLLSIIRIFFLKKNALQHYIVERFLF